MLFLKISDGSFKPWSSGAARVYPSLRQEGHLLTLGVYCRFGLLGEAELALLDTGAAWTVISADAVEPIAGELGEPIRPVRISTRHGVKEGHLYRIGVVLIADQGNDLEIEGTCAVLRDWSGPTVLGWSGLLEKLNLALHPGVGPGDEATLYFAPAEI